MKLKRGTGESGERKLGVLATDHQVEQTPEGEARANDKRGWVGEESGRLLGGETPEERISDVVAEKRDSAGTRRSKPSRA